MILLSSILLCGCSFQLIAQTSPVNDTLLIDASEHSFSYDRDKNLIQARQSTFEPRQAFLVALNSRVYAGEYLNHIILPYEKLYRKISFIQDKKLITRYTADPNISSVVAIKVSRAMARAIYQRLKAKGIVDIAYQ